VKPTEDPNHKGNSAEYHTGKPCIVKGCKDPAGTWWGPSWCQKHNHERLERIGSNLDDIIQRNELKRMVEEETKTLRDLLYKAYAENRGLIAAAGGKITVTKAHMEAHATAESVSYGKDGSKTYNYLYK